MPKVDFLEIWPKILCLVPVYTADGTNGTEVWLEEQKPLFFPYKPKTIVRRLAKAFTIDLEAARSLYSKVCGRRYGVPIPLRPGLVLIPIRSRHPQVKDDGALAYIVREKIAKIAPATEGTRITFTNGSCLEVSQRWASLRHVITDAELIARKAAELLGP